METVRTVACKLAPTPTQRTALDATLVAFADACNHVADVARQIHATNKVKVQHACYREVRDRFGLSANLAIRAIARVCAALKVKARAHATFDPTSVDYDQRIFSFREWDWTVSLTLVGATRRSPVRRERFEMALGDQQHRRLKGQEPTSATLVKRRNGTYFLHIQVKAPAPSSTRAMGVLGVDLGRRRVAVDSLGTTYAGEAVQSLRSHYLKIRRSLQAKGTRGAKRLLKRLSGYERRHMRAINHVISKELVARAMATNKAIALEELTGIRQRTKMRKAQRAQHHAWAFYQLRQFVQYKAQDTGIAVVLVDPAYTSKTCHCCGTRGHRDRLKFVCTRCGYVADADVNAALNIATAGALVTAPELAATG